SENKLGDSLEIDGYWLASGILGVSGSVMKRVYDAGADAIVTKSIGPVPRKGHSGPIMATSHGSLINAVGLTNPGIDGFASEMAVLKEAGVPVVLSIFGSTLEEIVSVARKGSEYAPEAIELNLSCPHAEIAQISHNPELTYKYVRAVKEVVDCSVFAKITPNASDIVSVGKAAEEAGADAIVAINTVRAMKIDIYQQRPVLGNLVGGLSGPAIFPIAVRCIYDLYNALDVPIIGVGGVSTWQDAIEMHLAGATAIQIGTALLGGMDIFERIKVGVSEYLQSMNYQDVSQIIGLAGRAQ
ncbi:MAG: dihydroorotate dehydrogenase, partial [Candidatus Thorarchaeota archaeon]